MCDSRSIVGLCVLTVNYAMYNFYLYELFWGDWEPIGAKSVFYLGTALVLLYYIFDELRGYKTLFQYHIKITYLLSLVVTFVLFYLTLSCKIASTRGIALMIYNTIIIGGSLAILYHGIKHKLFKHP